MLVKKEEKKKVYIFISTCFKNRDSHVFMYIFIRVIFYLYSCTYFMHGDAAGFSLCFFRYIRKVIFLLGLLLVLTVITLTGANLTWCPALYMVRKVLNPRGLLRLLHSFGEHVLPFSLLFGFGVRM